MRPTSGPLRVIREWLAHLRRFARLTSPINDVLKAAAAAVAVIGALAAVGRAAWQWYSVPRDSSVEAVYQGMGAAPVISLAAENKGRQPGSITRAMVLVQWQHADKPLEFGFELRIGTPLLIPPESHDVPLELPIWIPARLYTADNTTKDDITALLKPVKEDDLSTAPITHAHCQVQFDVVNASGTRQTKFADVDECLPFARWILLPKG
jgi:hypothetical protein